MLRKVVKKIGKVVSNSISMADNENKDTALLALGSMLSNQQKLSHSKNINDYEFKIFSQWGDDGIIQYLVNNVAIKNNVFIEFGVEDYLESNTRFLMMHNNWSGFVMDGSEEAMKSLEQRSWFWKYQLTNRAIFITRDNINDLIAATGFTDIGLLHIDLDGNDYHILNAMDFSKINPSILIMEYNSVLGPDRAITTPYKEDFYRTDAHYSNLYYGASLSALNFAANNKGYRLIGTNLAGNNAYFVREDLLNENVKEISVKEAYKESKFRESRNKDYSLSYLAGPERLELIRGLEVINVLTNEKEKL